MLTVAAAPVLVAAMTLALWLALYLLTRGSGSPLVRRTAIVLIFYSASAFLSFVNLYQPVPFGGAWHSALLTVSLLALYDLAYHLLPPVPLARQRWAYWAVMGLGALKIVLLAIFRDQLPSETGAVLWIVPGLAPWLAVLDVVFLFSAGVGLVLNFRFSMRIGLWPRFRSTWVAVLFTAAAAAYGGVTLISGAPVSRLPRDLLLTGGLVAVGYSIARHQALVQRSTVLQEMPVTGLTIAGLTGLYWLFGWRRLTPLELGSLALLAVLTHSVFDLVRETLDRLLNQRESALRLQLRGLAGISGDSTALHTNLELALDQMCGLLGASGAFVAARNADQFDVVAAVRLLAVGEILQAAVATTNELCEPAGSLAASTAWLAPVLFGGEQLGVVGLGRRLNGCDYAEADLDRLDEVADGVGRVFAAERQQTRTNTQVVQLAEKVTDQATQLQQQTEALLQVVASSPPPEFVREVEDGLRHLAEYPELGQLPLAARLCVAGDTHLARGKAVREALVSAIEALKPAGPRPRGVLPREWHAYAVLHDAYIEDVPNREIMSRLYISEGTFNRQRRRALTSVARALQESYPALA